MTRAAADSKVSAMRNSHGGNERNIGSASAYPIAIDSP